MKLIVERSEASGDWWVRCVARNGRIVGTSQEGYRNKAHAVATGERLAMPFGEWDLVSYRWAAVVVEAAGGWRWGIVAPAGRKVFGAHEALTKRAHAERMAYRVLTEAHDLEVRG